MRSLMISSAFVFFIFSAACGSVTQSNQNSDASRKTLGTPPGGTQSTWTLQPLPVRDLKQWQIKNLDVGLNSVDFPSLPDDSKGLPLKSGLQPVVKWTVAHDKQLKAWQQIFDGVENCQQRGRRRGKVYATFNECLSGATTEEQQYLSAQLVFSDIQEMRAKDSNSSRKMRAMVDTQNQIQCIVVTQKRPDFSYYSSHYKGAFPKGSVQIPALEIAYLLAAPWNLKQNDPRRVSGAGTACMRLAMLESSRLPWKGAIVLEASPSAVGYYQKFGFLAFGDTQDPRYGKLPVMWLGPEASQAELAKP